MCRIDGILEDLVIWYIGIKRVLSINLLGRLFKEEGYVIMLVLFCVGYRRGILFYRKRMNKLF